MRKSKQLLLFFVLSLGFMTFTNSCKTGEGCPDVRQVDTKKSDKRGKSNLFSKKQRKRMKR